MKASNDLVEKYGWDKIIHSPSDGRAVFRINLSIK